MYGFDTFFVSTVRATKKAAAGLNPVADDLAAAMLAFRRQGVNRAFETIEIMRDSRHHNLQRLVIFISANFASIHITPLVKCGSSLLIFLTIFLKLFPCCFDHLIVFRLLNTFFY